MNAKSEDKSAHIGAKVSRETFKIVNHAAVIRGWPRSKVVELGALAYAREILESASGDLAAWRKLIRQSKAREGGLARHRK